MELWQAQSMDSVMCHSTLTGSLQNAKETTSCFMMRSAWLVMSKIFLGPAKVSVTHGTSPTLLSHPIPFTRYRKIHLSPLFYQYQSPNNIVNVT